MSYSENAIVERPAIALFAELGWQTLSAMEEVFGLNGTLRRETPYEFQQMPKARFSLKIRPWSA